MINTHNPHQAVHYAGIVNAKSPLPVVHYAYVMVGWPIYAANKDLITQIVVDPFLSI